MKAMRVGLLIGLIATACAACAGTGATPPLSAAATTTLTSGWEYHFSLEWSAAEQGQSSRKVAGYITNKSGQFATKLRVFAQAVDSGGTVVGQRIAFIPGGVNGWGRAYFEVPDLPATASYRVSVWDYTWFQSGDGGKL